MAGGSLDFLINIQQKLTGGNAVSQLSQLESKIKAEGAALAQLEAVQKRMQKQGSVDIEQHRKLQGAIDQKKQGLAQLGQQYQDLAGQQAQAGGGMAELSAGMEELAAGPIGMVVAAVVALVTVLAVATYKLMAFALASADAHRSTMLMLQGATGSAAGASAAADAIDRVASTSAIAKEQIVGMAQALAVAGISGKLLESTLKTMATVASVAGPEAASKLENIAKKAKAAGNFEIKTKDLKGLGISMEEVAKAMGMSVAKMTAQMKLGKVSTEQGMEAMNKALQARFGDAAAKQALGFGVQMMKLQENLAGLFKDVNIEPFLKGLHEVLSVFDQTTPSGKALHLIITKVFSGLFAAVSMAAPYIKAFLLGMVAGMLLVYIYGKKVYDSISKAFGGDTVSKADKLKVAMYAGVAVAGLLVGSLVALAVAFVVMGAVALMAGLFMALPFILPLVAVGLLIYGIYKLVDALSEIQFPSLGDAAGNMIDGLVAGISGKIGDVVASMASLGLAAKDSLLSVLGIHSPSRVMMQAGGFTAQGFAEGVDDGAGKAQSAMAKMAAPPDVAAGSAGGKGKGSKGAVSIGQIGPFYGMGDGADLIDRIEEVVNDVFARLDFSGPEPAGDTP